MNSMIQLSQSPLSMAPDRLSSASRVRVSLSHGSLSVSQWSKQSHLVSRPLYVKCTLERFSEGSEAKDENGKKKNNIVRGVGRASLVLACVLGAITLSGKIKMNPKPNIAYAAQDRSRGKNGFFKSSVPDAKKIEALKLYTMALSLNEDYKDLAEEIMQDEYKTYKGKTSGDANERIRNMLAVALIELLLHQGKYERAKEVLEEARIGKDDLPGVPMDKVKLLQAMEKALEDSQSSSEIRQFRIGDSN